MTGWALLVFSAFSWVLEVNPYGPVPLGRTLYAPVRDLPLGLVNTSVLYALLFNACMFTVAWSMWRRKWFVKV